MGLLDKLLGSKAETKSELAPTEDTYQPSNYLVNGESPETVSLAVRIKSAYPSATGLYPHEILALDYSKHFTTNQTEFQTFWLYRYSVDDVQKVLKSLLKRGYLTTGGIEATLNAQTIAQLKPTLQAYGLKVTGKKAALIRSLLASVPEEKLWTAFPVKYYMLTGKGEAELEANPYVVATHKHAFDDLDIWTVNQLLHVSPGKTYREVIWDYLLRRAKEHYAHNNFGLYGNTRLNTYFFLKQEKRHEDAFRYLAEVLYVDLSGCDNNFSMEPFLFGISANHFFPYEKSLAQLPPAAVDWLNDMEREMDWDDAELERQLEVQMKSFKMPFHIFTVPECAKVAVLHKNDDKHAIEQIYKDAETRFRKKYPKINIDRE